MTMLMKMMKSQKELKNNDTSMIPLKLADMEEGDWGGAEEIDEEEESEENEEEPRKAVDEPSENKDAPDLIRTQSEERSRSPSLQRKRRRIPNCERSPIPRRIGVCSCPPPPQSSKRARY